MTVGIRRIVGEVAGEHAGGIAHVVAAGAGVVEYPVARLAREAGSLAAQDVVAALVGDGLRVRNVQRRADGAEQDAAWRADRWRNWTGWRDDLP
jgi:hypothetical protein